MKWVKPSGLEIETNDKKETVEYAESLGWKPAEKKKRRTKAEMEAEKKPEE